MTLADGPVSVTEIRDQADDQRIYASALAKAKQTLGVWSQKQGMESGWAWSLPPTADAEPEGRPPAFEADPLHGP